MRKIVVGVAVVYLALLVGMLVVMSQPPAVFGKVMSKLPAPLVLVLPFKQLWFIARAGHLRLGDAAPDFKLLTIDKRSRVQLSSFRGHKPVVLIFGSYT